VTFCFNCGRELPTPEAKFCPNCGQPQFNPKDNKSSPVIQSPQTVPNMVAPPPQLGEENFEQSKPRAYLLGVKLEETVANIFEKMGYTVQRRVRPATKTGATAEIDILLTRGNRRLAVECKNYDESRAVGVSELRNFRNKLEDTGIMSGVFVTTTVFTGDAEQFAESTGIELWDKEKLLEKFYAFAIGRIVNPGMVNDPVLPIVCNFDCASTISLRNPQSVRLFSKVLLYHPYYLVKYRLRMTRKDPGGSLHKFGDEGLAIVDALDGEIINREKSVFGALSGLFKSKEERVESKEDRLVTKDLLEIIPRRESVLRTSDYEVNVAEPEVSDNMAVRIVRGYVIDKNTQSIAYEPKGKSGDSLFSVLEKPSIKVVPKPGEIEIRGVKLVYVPKWDLQYESGNATFQRSILASSGAIIEDGLAKCRKRELLRRPAIAVCDICGIPLCEKHVYRDGERWVCEDHASQAARETGKGFLGG